MIEYYNMRLRILNDSFNFLNENDDIEIEKEITPSEKNNYSIQIIKNKVNGWLTTICDYFNEIFFGMRPAISNIEQDYNLSRDMSNLFVDTTVNVYIYNSKILNAFTFPGAPQLGRFVNIIWLQQYLGKFGVIISNIWRSIKDSKSNRGRQSWKIAITLLKNFMIQICENSKRLYMRQ